MSVVDIFDFDIRCLTFDKINPVYQAKIDKEGKGMSGQYSIFAKYDGKPLSLCLTIEHFVGGQTSNMDRNKKEFCDINDPQIKFTIGLNPLEESCVKLKEILKQIEKKLDDNLEELLSDELKSKGKPFKNYVSVSAIKPYKMISDDDPDTKIEVEDTEEHYGKFILKYFEDLKTKQILSVFESDTENEDGGYVKYPSESRADIAKIRMYNKKIRIMFKLIRVWVSKTPSQFCGGKKGYGITYKLQRVHVFDTIEQKQEIDESGWFSRDVKRIEKKDKKNIKDIEEIEEEEEIKEEIINENVNEQINEEEVLDNIVEIIEEQPKQSTRRKIKRSK